MRYGLVAVKASFIIAMLAGALFIYLMYADKPQPSPVAWMAGDDDPAIKMYLSGETLYVIGSTNISALNSSGHKLWSIAFGDTRYSTLSNRTLLAYSGSGGLISISGDGSFSMLASPQITSPPIISDGTIVFRTWDRVSSCAPGKLNVSGVILGPEASGRLLYMVVEDTARSRWLACYDVNGSELWKMPLQGRNVTRMLAREDGVIAYDYPAGEAFKAVSPGSIAWSYSAPGGGLSDAIPFEGGCFLIYRAGSVHIINDRGGLLAKFNHNIVTAGKKSPLAFDNGTVYLAGPGNDTDAMMFYAISMDGPVKWSTPLGGSGPADVYAFNETICVATEKMDGSRLRPILYVLREPGNVIISYFSEDGRPFEQVCIGSGRVFARTYGGMIYAF